jgi:hypothetical protein
MKLDATLIGPGDWSGGFSVPPHHVEVSDLPSSSENPGVNMLCSFPTPALLTPNRFLCESLLPSTRPEGVGFQGNIPNFGAQSHSLLTRCTCFVRRVASPHAVLASSRSPPFAGEVSDLSDSHWKVSDVSVRILRYVIVFPLPDASWRTGPRRVLRGVSPRRRYLRLTSNSISVVS